MQRVLTTFFEFEGNGIICLFVYIKYLYALSFSNPPFLFQNPDLTFPLKGVQTSLHRIGYKIYISILYKDFFEL